MNNTITKLMKICAWCGLYMGDIDGKGVEGVTYCICPKCADKEWTKLGGRPPKLWNFIGRLIYHFRQRNAYVAKLEAERNFHIEQEKIDRESEKAVEIITSDPDLDPRVILTGKNGLHYIDAKLGSILLEYAKDKPEIKARWN